MLSIVSIPKMRKLLIKAVNWLEDLPGKETKPNFCCLGVTDDCLLRCKMCYKWQRDIFTKDGEDIPSLFQWKDAIASLRKITQEGFLINFGGGEPLLKDGILDLVRFAADLGFKTNIATNAFLIDENMAKKIAGSGLSKINISLDSFKETTHDCIRGAGGVFAKAMKAIEYLHRYCPNLEVGICCVISQINIDDTIELTEIIEDDNRLKWIYFMAIMQPNNTTPDLEWYKNEFNYLWPKDIKRVRSTINRLIELKNKGYKIANQASQLKAFESYFADPRKFIKVAGCNLSRAVHVSSTGDVFICFLWEKLGNIKSDRIEDLWRSGKAEAIRRDVAGCKNNCHFLINCFFEGDFPF